MKKKIILFIVTVVTLIAFPKSNFSQTPDLGTVADFALFSTAGAVTSSSSPIHLTHITGNIGAAPASISGFGNVDGVLYQGGTEFEDASTDLLAAYDYLNDLTPTDALATPFGGGDILTPGVYNIENAAIWLTGDIILDAQNDPEAVFVFQLDGAFNTSTDAKVKLINGAQACNVFWKVEGAVSMAAGTYMAGSVIANNDFISMAAGDTLQGRALAINGAVSVNEVMAYIPLGCERPVLTGPPLPELNSVECYAIFSSDGPVQDDFETFVLGDVGTNLGSTLGYDPLKVTGTIHEIPDASTAECAADLGDIYNDINAMPYDIELMEPSLFGHNLVLTPHTYLMLSAVTFTDTLYLDAQGNPDATFVFKINGAFETSTFSRVVLINGAQAKNVYWKIDGAVEINDFSIFNGTFVSAGAIELFTGVVLNGRALTIVGAINTFSAEVNTPTGTTDSAGTIVGPDTVCQGQTDVIYSVSEIENATSYTWTLPPGTTITDGQDTDSITVDFDETAESGTWNITVQGSSVCGSGEVSLDFEVEVGESPVMDSVENQSICADDSTTTIVFSGGDIDTDYDWTNDNTSIGLAASGTGDINSFEGVNNGTDPEVAVITVIPSNSVCEGDSMSFTITVNNTPVVDSISDQTICSNEFTETVVFTGGSTSTTYDWTNDNTSIGLDSIGSGDINSFQGVNNDVDPQEAIITVTPSNDGCLGDSTSFSITVNNSPVADTISDQSICSNEFTETVVFTGGLEGTTYDWTNDNTSIGLDANGSGDIDPFEGINNGNEPEVAVITVTPSNDVCSGDSMSFTITVTNSPFIDFVPDQSVCSNEFTETIVFTGGPEGTIYNWTNSNPSIGLDSIGNGDIDSFQTVNETDNTVFATITVTADFNGCEGDSTTFSIDVINCYDFNIPEGFSPNGDNINDLFVIRGIEQFPDNSFLIFNRWGVKLFESSPYQNNWDGKASMGLTVGGDKLPVGTYFYILDLGEGSDAYTGTIYLNR